MSKASVRKMVWIAFLFIAATSGCQSQTKAPMARSSASLNPETSEVVTPDEPAFKALLPRLLKSDAEADQLTRCLNYPDPPKLHWPRKASIALCHHNLDKYVSLKEVAALLEQGQSAKVDALFANYQKEQQSGKNPDVLDLALFAVFGHSSKLARDTADAWLHASPHSALALAASGLQYETAAESARGSDFYGKTPAQNIAQMHALNAKADADLTSALSIDPKLSIVFGLEANISMRQRSREEALDWIQKGMAAFPDNDYLHTTNASNAEPRWGGSKEELKDAKALASRNASTNPILIVQSSRVDYELKACSCSHDSDLSMRDYAAITSPAPVIRALRAAGGLAVEGHNWPVGIVYLSEAMRFSPWLEPEAHVNRGIALAFLGDFDAAQRDADVVLAALPDDKSALQLRDKMIPAFRAEAEAIKRDAHQH